VKIEVIYLSEASTSTYETIRCHMTEDSINFHPEDGNIYLRQTTKPTFTYCRRQQPAVTVLLFRNLMRFLYGIIGGNRLCIDTEENNDLSYVIVGFVCNFLYTEQMKVKVFAYPHEEKRKLTFQCLLTICYCCVKGKGKTSKSLERHTTATG
jgi:hypothetical protein